MTVFPPDPESVDMNASNNSLGFAVEKLTVLIELLAEELSPETVRSIARELPEVCETAELSSPKRQQNTVTRSTQTCKRLMRDATFFFLNQVVGQLMQFGVAISEPKTQVTEAAGTRRLREAGPRSTRTTVSIALPLSGTFNASE